jgi:hypothetical protein
MSEVAEGAPVGAEVLVPVTGELLPLDAPSAQLAEAVLRMRELEQQLAAARQLVGAELTHRLDMENLRSAEVDGLKVTVAAPGRDWNTDTLAGVLDELVEESVITPAAMDRIVVLERKVKGTELRKLLATLPEAEAARLRACSKPNSRVRSVKVEDLNAKLAREAARTRA